MIFRSVDFCAWFCRIRISLSDSVVGFATRQFCACAEREKMQVAAHTNKVDFLFITCSLWQASIFIRIPKTGGSIIEGRDEFVEGRGN